MNCNKNAGSGVTKQMTAWRCCYLCGHEGRV